MYTNTNAGTNTHTHPYTTHSKTTVQQMALRAHSRVQKVYTKESINIEAYEVWKNANNLNLLTVLNTFV